MEKETGKESEVTRHISTTDTAKLVRKALKREFPGQKFSVRSHSYSGGSSIDVIWTDGPRTKSVDSIVNQYGGSRFDGMIDMAVRHTTYLRADGSTMIAHEPGTEGSKGTIPSEDNRNFAHLLPEDAEEVQFGANYIFCQREVTNFELKVTEAEIWIRLNCHIDKGNTPQSDRFGNEWVGDIANMMAHNWLKGQDWGENFENRRS